MERDLNTLVEGASNLPVYPLHLHIEHPQFGTVANIVLETSVWRRAVGGIRMLQDVTAEQVADLARAMTHKFAFLNMPFAGAKGGIISSPDWYPDHKAEVLEYIGKAVAQLIRNGLYTPGPDLGVGLGECWTILRGAGISTPDRDPDVWTDALDSPGFPTGLTVKVVADEALGSLGLTTAGASIAIEGFGKVGASAAKLFSDAGAKIIAVSTASGALYASDGLDVDKLLASRARYGDEFVLDYAEAETIPKDALLTLPVDVLCPCAGQWTLGARNMDSLQCKVISSGSNCSIEPLARERLENDPAVLVMPDFISSSGTVLASNLIGTRASRLAVIETQFRARVRSVLEQSHKLGVSPVSFAKIVAAENLRTESRQLGHAKREERIYATASRIAALRHVPSGLRNSMTRYFSRKWLEKNMYQTGA